jgi:hypothetical protein
VTYCAPTDPRSDASFSRRIIGHRADDSLIVAAFIQAPDTEEDQPRSPPETSQLY